jgi:hypothetical protein
MKAFCPSADISVQSCSELDTYLKVVLADLFCWYSWLLTVLDFEFKYRTQFGFKNWLHGCESLEFVNSAPIFMNG